MGRRSALLLASGALALVLGVIALSTSLFAAARRALDEVTELRLAATGATAARLLAPSAGAPAPSRAAEGERDLDRALADVARANELDGAYLFDERFRIVADARGRAARAANLLRLDPDRARDALDGRATVGPAFDIDGMRFLGGYFPVAPTSGGAGRLALALEAGATFTTPSRRLRSAAAAALALEAALGALALAVLAAALRASRREREAYGRAERAAVASRMAAMLAHEIRNPLGIIRAGAELIGESADGRGRALVDDIVGEVARLNALTEEFLTLARDSPLRLAPVDLARLVEDACAGVRLRHRDGLKLESRVSLAEPVLADEARLRQALLNLLLNAAEATGGRGHVVVEVEGDRAGTRLVVSDDGPGVPDELRARLFEPFASGKPTGTGLGLAVARRILEQHGGRLALVPARRGARFEAWLPPTPVADAVVL